MYNEISNAIISGKVVNARQVLDRMKVNYVEAEVFKSAFKTKSVSTKNNKLLARYIMFSIENRMNGSSLNYRTDDGTIEHILPENPDQAWFKYFDEEQISNFIYRLGNYSILEAKYNREIGNKLISDKLEKYSLSRYMLSKEFSKTKWDKTELENRQNALGNIANDIWKLEI